MPLSLQLFPKRCWFVVTEDLARLFCLFCVRFCSRAQAQAYVQFGRHFDVTNTLCSKLTRESIDLLKENFRNDLEKED